MSATRWLSVFIIFTFGVAGIAALAEQGRGRVSDSIQGQAKIVDGNLTQARDQAMQQAFRSRVSRAVSTTVPAPEREQNAELLENRIYSHAEDFITQYRIEGQEIRDDWITVRLEVIVNLEALRIELIRLGLTSGAARPSVFVIIEEPAPESGALRTGWSAPAGQPGTPGECESQVYRALRMQDFEVIEPLADNDRIDPEFMIRPGEDRELVYEQLKQRFGADYLIVGQARTRIGERSPGSGVIKSKAELKLAVADVRERRTIKVINQQAEAEGSNIKDSSQQSLVRVCQAALPEITAALPKPEGATEAVQQQSILVAFDNLESYKALSELRAYMASDIPGVAAVELNSMGPGWVKFDVEYMGSSERLVSAFTRHAFSMFSLRVEELASKNIRFSVKRSGI